MVIIMVNDMIPSGKQPQFAIENGHKNSGL
jgi:hypothetical protein